jgi:FtsP/CotA-like multicopper oxidase with cupredoxin domain
VRTWGYNGSSPGPTIECVEGDRVRILVTNRLPEATTVHWHGILLPSGMDGVGGLSQPPIPPGETWVYEFTLRQHGTFLYHPHADEMVQMALGLMGFLIVHPRDGEEQPVDRDYAILPHEWAIHPGNWRPDPAVMLDFNLFTFNGKVFPATGPLLARTGERVRIRFGNLSMNEHPIHLHGYSFQVTATDGGVIPPGARWPQTTVPVPVGSTRDIRFTADAAGDWALHCHKSHHTMNAMGHELPNLIGVDQGEEHGRPDLEARIRALLPGYRAMGRDGMSEHGGHLAHLRGPRNTLPMMGGTGPYGSLEMGGMFTVLKVRDELDGNGDPGWYQAPPGTRAYRLP